MAEQEIGANGGGGVDERDGSGGNNGTGSWWKVPRRARAGALQLARRQSWPDMPFIHGEILDRMLERSEIMRPEAGCVIDMSLGRMEAGAKLMQRFQDRQVLMVRWGQPVLPASAGGWLSRQLERIRGKGAVAMPESNIRSLPDEFADLGEVPPCGLVWSNGLLHRAADPAALLRRWRSLLRPGGALFFSCFGPDTARELSGAARQAGLEFPDFADMHDWGDLLVKSGFSDPVMEMERLVLTYRSVDDLLRDWHAMGGNAAMMSGRGLLTRHFRQRLHNCLQTGGDGGLQITLEILYGHAWRVDRPAATGEVRIPVTSIGRKR